MAGRRPLHPARPARLRPGRSQGRGHAARGRLGPGHPARGRRGRGGVDLVRGIAGRGARAGARAACAAADEVERPLHRAPAGLPRLHRRQALRRQGPGARRAALRRPVHLDGLQRQPGRDPAAAPQGRRGHRARRLPAQQPRREGAGHDPEPVPARRAVPDRGRRALRHRDGHPAPGRAPAHAPVRAPRRLRALRLLPGLRAARELQHRPARAHAGAADRGPARRLVGVLGAVLGFAAGARHDRRAHPRRRRRAGRRARARAAPGRHRAQLGRRVAQGAGRGLRRGARQCAVRALRPRFCRRLPRRPRAARGRARHRDDGVAGRPRRAGDEPVRAARSATRAPALQARARGPAGAAVAKPADARAHGRAGARGAALRGQARRPGRRCRDELWIDDFGMRVPGSDEIDVERLRSRFQEAVSRTWRGDNENDDFNRLVLRGRAGLARRDRAAGLRALHEAGRVHVQPGLHRTGAGDARRDRGRPGGAVHRALRSGTGGRPRRDAVAHRGPHQGRARPCRQPRRRPHPAPLPGADRSHAAHQLLPAPAGGAPKPVLSLKFDPAKVPGLPEPKPMFEIFVCSPRVEGVHLRLAAWPAAACAGRTGWKTSAPRCWAWSRRSR